MYLRSLRWIIKTDWFGASFCNEFNFLRFGRFFFASKCWTAVNYINLIIARNLPIVEIWCSLIEKSPIRWLNFCIFTSSNNNNNPGIIKRIYLLRERPGSLKNYNAIILLNLINRLMFITLYSLLSQLWPRRKFSKDNSFTYYKFEFVSSLLLNQIYTISNI